MEKERNVILLELKQAENDPDDIIQDYFEKAIFKTIRFGMPVIGNAQSITSFHVRILFNSVNRGHSCKSCCCRSRQIKHEKVVELSRRTF